MFDPHAVLLKYCPDYRIRMVVAEDDDPFYGETVHEDREIYLTQHWQELNDEGQHYVVLHEACHAMRGPDEGHSNQFYTLLEALVFENGIDPVEACILEQFAPDHFLEEYWPDAWKRVLERAAADELAARAG